MNLLVTNAQNQFQLFSQHMKRPFFRVVIFQFLNWKCVKVHLICIQNIYTQKRMCTCLWCKRILVLQHHRFTKIYTKISRKKNKYCNAVIWLLTPILDSTTYHKRDIDVWKKQWQLSAEHHLAKSNVSQKPGEWGESLKGKFDKLVFGYKNEFPFIWCVYLQCSIRYY